MKHELGTIFFCSLSWNRSHGTKPEFLFVSISSRTNMMFYWVRQITSTKSMERQRSKSKTVPMDARHQRRRMSFGLSRSCRWNAITTSRRIPAAPFISNSIKCNSEASITIIISMCQAQLRTRKLLRDC